ncbi:ATP-binding protein [Photobacterium makurazakiensis]|uniref:sensor histidine kinase n=1 Tax=Photobacterium makurazakiensis TaxID=2910234 RepID=UPI003D0D3CF7
MSYFYTFLVYLLYGLAFFSIGCTILFRNFRHSKLVISHSLWALAAFGFAYAFYEWSELYINLFGDRIREPKSTFIEWLRLTKLTIAFFFLMLFSWMVTVVNSPIVKKIMRLTLFTVTLIYCAIFIYTFSTHGLSKAVIDNTESYARYILAFPAALIAGLSLVNYGRKLIAEKKRHGRYFRVTGYAFIVLSVISGIISRDNNNLIFNLQLIVAYILLISLYLSLNVFDKEKQRIIASQLRQAYISDKYKAIGQLASGVAHEINNPLSSSTLSLDMLEERLSDDKQVELVKRTRLGIDRASTICRELLIYSRSGEESTQLSYIHRIITSALQLLSHKTKGYKITVNCEKYITLLTNPIKIEELIINLLSNAIDASHVGSEIMIDVKETMINDCNYVILSVTDQGCGMDISTQEKALEPFFTTKPIGKGTGLGLAICAEIATDHRGELTINSRKNIGTTITAKLAKEM